MSAAGTQPAPTLPAPQRVALVHDWLTGLRGGEHVLREVCALFPGAPIYTLFHHPDDELDAAFAGHPVHTSFLQGKPFTRRHYRHWLPLFPMAVEDFDLAGRELVISSSHCVAKGAVPPPDALHVCYCHSPVRYAWDQEHVYFPRRRGVANRLRALVLGALRVWDVASAARVDVFAANSSFVAERIRRYYRRDATVVPPPVDTEHFTPGEGEGEGGGYALTLAAAAPYKRLEVAIEACERLGLELRVAGGRSRDRRYRRLAGGHTRLLGRVDRERLRALYRGAVCFLQPGVEDFGIAPVEALACGAPVVALAAGGVLDVVEDGVHGVLYGGGDAGALAAAIDKSRQIRFNELNLRGRAEHYSRARFRERFLELIRQSFASHAARRDRPNRQSGETLP